MLQAPETVPSRTMGEWELYSRRPYSNPFSDVTVEGTFTSPSRVRYTLPGFYDGDITWRIRFNPKESGEWHYSISSRPEDVELAAEGTFEVVPRETRGFLRSTPGSAWGFEYESGEFAFLLGDTVYNLFGMAYCGVDVVSFLERRAQQGFNLLRVRLPVSLFHPPDGYNQWQTHRTWPWGGSEQAPQFDRFNLSYFRVVDQVVRECERLSIGLEMIMEGWGFEFPFNSRQIFLPEWEEMWMRWLVARYDAFGCVYFWTLLNEYEYYPNGDWHYKPVADRWAMRVARWVKGQAQHGHIVAVHNGPVSPRFAQRFAADPEAVDAIMFQTWGTTGKDDAWLAAGIEEQIQQSLDGWRGSAVFAEWGYERNPELELKIPGHLYCDPDHTRRGAWRGAFCSLGIIHGFENSWGPWQVLNRDQPGLQFLLHLHAFFTQHVPFSELSPAPDLLASEDYERGHRPLVLSTPDRSTIALYLPTGGSVTLSRSDGCEHSGRWYDPRTGMFTPAAAETKEMRYASPGGGGERPWDWVLLLQTQRSAE